jgi:hypothetical protein
LLVTVFSLEPTRLFVHCSMPLGEPTNCRVEHKTQVAGIELHSISEAHHSTSHDAETGEAIETEVPGTPPS